MKKNPILKLLRLLIAQLPHLLETVASKHHLSYPRFMNTDPYSSAIKKLTEEIEAYLIQHNFTIKDFLSRDPEVLKLIMSNAYLTAVYDHLHLVAKIEIATPSEDTQDISSFLQRYS